MLHTGRHCYQQKLQQSLTGNALMLLCFVSNPFRSNACVELNSAMSQSPSFFFSFSSSPPRLQVVDLSCSLLVLLTGDSDQLLSGNPLLTLMFCAPVLQLGWLDLSNNSITGTLPTNWSSLNQVRMLLLHLLCLTTI